MFRRPPENRNPLHELQEKLNCDSRDSLQLLENFQDNPICSVRLDEADRCIMVEWRQYATELQFRYIHEKLLSLICKYRVFKILGDDTALPAIPSEDRHWIVDEWFPRALECGLQFIANRPPDAYFGNLAVSQIRSAAPAGLQFRSFTRVEEARQWLKTLTDS